LVELAGEEDEPEIEEILEDEEVDE